MEWVGFPRTDPFFTDLSGLTLQSGVGVGPGGRLVKDEYTVGGGGTAAAAAAAMEERDRFKEVSKVIFAEERACLGSIPNMAASDGNVSGPTPNITRPRVR